MFAKYLNFTKSAQEYLILLQVFITWLSNKLKQMDYLNDSILSQFFFNVVTIRQ